MNGERTLEQHLKHDVGLSIGITPITLSFRNTTRRALVEITSRGVVRILPEPMRGDMYSSWLRIKGNDMTTKGCGVVVWGARDPELKKRFLNPAATVDVSVFAAQGEPL